KEDLKKSNLNADAKPFVFALGEGMFLKGIDEFLIGKEIGQYKIELKPEDAFGPRNPKMIQMIPIKVFREQKINPVQGIMFNFDGRPAKILTVSGGRVMVDFNNPVAGKEVVYDVKVLKKIDDANEKVKALNDFFFRGHLKFHIQDSPKGTSKKVIFEVEKPLVQFVDLFKDKFKEILDMEIEAQEVEGKQKEEPKTPK
ncbi:MAG: FKBP-type peptidyl-prolyl cis-trans isomerase, partial [Nanoarchaeota archaeon]